jgi:hypothetical protein
MPHKEFIINHNSKGIIISKIFLVYTIIYILLFLFYNHLFSNNYDYIDKYDSNNIRQKTTGEIITDAIYFSTTTSATVGYGDIYPIHWTSKMLVSSHHLILIFVMLYGF